MSKFGQILLYHCRNTESMLELAGRRTVRFSVLLLILLLAVQVIPRMPAVLASSQAPAPLTGSATTKASFSPDYMILGELRGSSIFQSELPRSLPIDQGVQWATTYYTAKDLAQAYGATTLFASGDDGKGQTIAIIDAYGDPTIYQDVARFSHDFGLPQANLTVIPVGPYEPANGITYGWDVETALDVEAAHTMAPYAHINLVVGANNSNALYDAVRLVVDDHLGNVVSMSWGSGENLYGESGFSAAGLLNYPYLDYYFQKGTQEGTTFFSSSGDYGAYDGSYMVTADFPPSSPFVTAVGGTTLFLSSTSGYVSDYNSSASYQGEQAWSVSPQYIGLPGVSSGGGISDFFAQPYYQAGAYQSTHRTEPDVAADANPYTGLVMVVEGKTIVIGGTSLASPLWAGMTADMDQYLGRSIGLLNPYLYSIYSDKSEYQNAFHQVTSGFDGEYSAGSGYNLVTGLGSPNLPALASDLKSMGANMSVTVSTSQGAGGTAAPAQYAFGDNFTIAAKAKLSGSAVTSGAFSADIASPSGSLGSVPLSYNGSAWVGKYVIAPSAPSGSWTITVRGTSGGSTGTGVGDVNVGASLGILSPVPYPYATVIPPKHSFQIAAVAQAYSGPALSGQSLRAYLINGGQMVAMVPLTETGTGYYTATTQIGSDDPQGSYTLVVNGTGVGSVYEYFYVGEGIIGVIEGPNDEAMPSAAPGEQVVLLAEAETSDRMGIFTSNITAKFYSLSGTLMATATLKPSPDTTQFGDLNFFPYQQANFTIPASFAPGFYKVQFLSSYSANKTGGTQLGNFTTGFYVSEPLGSYTVSHQSAVFEGQNVDITAKISDSSGNPVTSGVFFATIVPSGYAYEAYVTDFYGYTGVPLQYSQALGEWEGVFQFPSALTSPSAFFGNTIGLNYGPYTVFISGESSSATNVVNGYSYVNVLPYTWIGDESISPSTVGGIPLVAVNGTSYTLSNVAAGSLSIRGMNVTLSNDNIQSLMIGGGSRVTLSDSQVTFLSASGSVLSLTQGSSVGHLSLNSTMLTVSGSSFNSLSPALPTITVTGLSSPVSDRANFTVSIVGQQITNGSLAATVDGNPLSLNVAPSSTGIIATGAIEATTLPDGVHTLVVKVAQSDGMSATSATQFATDAHAASVMNKVTSLSNEAAQWTNLSYGITALAVVAIVIAIWALMRKPKPPTAAMPKP
jgi:subtilase family serine protease